MKVYIAVFVFQVFFNVFKTMEIKYTYERRVLPLMINSVWINLVSLCSMYLSLERLFARDWSVVLVYILGSVLGKWVAMEYSEKYSDELGNRIKSNKFVNRIFIGIKNTKK